MASTSLTDALKEEARRLGFDLAGACPACAPPRIEPFRRWLAAGFAGRMRYLGDRAEAYEHPRHVLGGVRSILMLAMNYRTVEPAAARGAQGRVSRYAWGKDYHDLIHARLERLAKFHRRLRPMALVRGVVDTAPLLERDFAQLAGLGWIGKNTLLVNKQLGSWLFLAALLTSEELDHDQPFDVDHCGSCRACLDACPTGALVEARLLDARRCISYLTIELRESVPAELRPLQRDWVFGCDVCQEVCPWNRSVPSTSEESLHPAPGMNPIDLPALLALHDAAFRRRFRRTPLWRARRRGLLRSTAIALGNRPEGAALAALVRGLGDAEPEVRAACAWALGRQGAPAAQRALRDRLPIEPHPEVHREIEGAIRY
jgi:epoxyqueuosine reductase